LFCFLLEPDFLIALIACFADDAFFFEEPGVDFFALFRIFATFLACFCLISFFFAFACFFAAFAEAFFTLATAFFVLFDAPGALRFMTACTLALAFV